MKAVLVLALLLTSQFALAYQLFSNPMVKSGGKTYEIVIYDISTKTSYLEGYGGFCRSKGFSRGSDATQSYRDGYGPYVILDTNGKIANKFPAEGNEGRFRTMFQVYCE